MGIDLYQDPKKVAKRIFEGLVYFTIVMSTDPKIKAALMRLTELRLKVQEELDIITPGYLEE